jgi:hypothetical protein
MQSLTLSMPKDEFVRALQTLAAARRRKRGASVPVWLRFNAGLGQLTISEARGKVLATVPAEGDWPPTGATVDLIMLRNAARSLKGAVAELKAIDDAILMPIDKGYVNMKLLPFGPDSKRTSRLI